jgi:hypothetical protein
MEIRALKGSYKIMAAGVSCESMENDFEFIELNNNLSDQDFLTFHYKYPSVLRKVISFFISLFFKMRLHHKLRDRMHLKNKFNQFKNQNLDLIIVHHFVDLALAVKLAKYKNVKLIFNAHEYYPLEFDDDQNWMETVHVRYVNIAKKYLKYINVCFCVGEKIAKKYKQEFNLDSIVITNSKSFYNLNPSPLKNNDKIKLIHHGGAIRSRKIELMIQMMKYLNDNYTLDLILIPDEEAYWQELKVLASNYTNIRFIKPVSTNEISNYINKYDIGVYILPNNSFNNTYALPNKFFEFIQARLAIAISPSPEMAFIVNKYDLGIVADDFTPQSLASKIKILDSERIMHYKNNAHRYAEELSVENNEFLIKKTVDTLL